MAYKQNEVLNYHLFPSILCVLFHFQCFYETHLKLFTVQVQSQPILQRGEIYIDRKFVSGNLSLTRSLILRCLRGIYIAQLSHSFVLRRKE